MKEPVLYDVTLEDAASSSTDFTAVVSALLQLGGCQRAVVSIEPPEYVRILVSGGQEAIEPASGSQQGTDPNKPSKQFPSGLAWSLPVVLKPGEGLSQLSQAPVLVLRCCCGKVSKPCSSAADAMQYMQRHMDHNPAWAQQQGLQQQLEQQLKQQQLYQKQQPQIIQPIQRTAACICVEVAYLLLRTPSLRSFNWLNQLAQTILFHRVIWYMTSTSRPSSTQLLQQNPTDQQQKRSQHLLWLLVGAPPYCQSALALQGGLKHYSLEALCLVTLLHELRLLPKPRQQSGGKTSTPPTEQQVLAALQQLLQHFTQGIALPGKASPQTPTAGSSSTSQTQPSTADRTTVESLLRLRGLELQDIVLTASEEVLDTQLDVCVFCGDDYEPPGEQLTQCRLCCHSYHVSCATDLEETGVSWTAEAVAAAKRGTCLGCQGFPLMTVAATGAGSSSSRSPKKGLPWGNAERCTKDALADVDDLMINSGKDRLSASPRKGKPRPPTAADIEDERPRRGRSTEPEAAAAAGSGGSGRSKWPCQPAAAAAVSQENVLEVAEQYLRHTLTTAKQFGISVQTLDSSALLRYALLPPGMQLDFITAASETARARFEVLPAVPVAAAAAGGGGSGGATQKQRLQCSVCKVELPSFAAAHLHACGRPANNASKYLKLVGAGDMSIKDFLQWLKEREAHEQHQQQQQQRGSASQTTEAAVEVLQLLATGARPPPQQQQQQQPGRQPQRPPPPAAAAASPRQQPSSAATAHAQFSGQSVAAILEDMAHEHLARDVAEDAAAVDAAVSNKYVTALPPTSSSPADSVALGKQPAAYAAPTAAAAAAAATQQHQPDGGPGQRLPVRNLPAGLRMKQGQQSDAGAAARAAAAARAVSGAAAAAAASASGHKRSREHERPVQSGQQLQQQQQRVGVHVDQVPQQQQEQERVRADPVQQQQQQNGGSDSSANTSTAPTPSAPADSTDEIRPRKQLKAAASGTQQQQQQQQKQPQQQGAGQQQARQSGRPLAQPPQQSSKQQQLKPAAKKHRSSQQAKAAAPKLSPADKVGLQHLVKLRWQLCAVPDVRMRYHLEQILQAPNAVTQAVINKLVGIWAADAADGSGGSSSSRTVTAAATAAAGGGRAAGARCGWNWELLMADKVAEGVLDVLQAAECGTQDTDQQEQQFHRCCEAIAAVYSAVEENPAAAAAASGVGGDDGDHGQGALSQQQQQHEPQTADRIARLCRELVRAMLLLTKRVFIHSITSNSDAGKVADAVLELSSAAAKFVCRSSSGGGSKELQHPTALVPLHGLVTTCCSLQKLLGVLDEATWTNVWKVIRREVKQLRSTSSHQQSEHSPNLSTSDAICPVWMIGVAWLLKLIASAPTGWQKVLNLVCDSTSNQTAAAAPDVVSAAAAAALHGASSKRQPLLLTALYEVFRQCKKIEALVVSSSTAGRAGRTAGTALEQQVQVPEAAVMSVAAQARQEVLEVLIPAYEEALTAVSGVLRLDDLQPKSGELAHGLVLQLVSMMRLVLRALLLSNEKIEQLLAFTSEGIKGSVVGYTSAKVQQVKQALEAMTDAASDSDKGAGYVVECTTSGECRCAGHKALADCEYLTGSLKLTLTVFESCG